MKRIDGTAIGPRSTLLQAALERERQSGAEWAAYQAAHPEVAAAWLEALDVDHAREVDRVYRAGLIARADAKLAAMGLPAHVVAAAMDPASDFEPLAVAREFLDRRGPQFLLLLGSGGVGKTVAGVWVLREVMRSGGRAETIRARDLAALSDFDEDDRWRFERLCSADAVLLDDLEPADLGSPRSQVVFRDWFDRRMAKPHLRTVITSNLGKTKARDGNKPQRPTFGEVVGPRFVDRLAECGMSEEWQGDPSRRERRFPREVKA